MELVLRTEKIAQVVQELDDFMHNYWLTSPDRQERPELLYDWRAYEQLNDAGIVKLYVARNDDHKLVAVAIYALMKHLHHLDHPVADCDTFIVDASVRGCGIGKLLIEYSERQLRELDVQEVMHHTREAAAPTSLFHQLGYKPLFLQFSKRLD